MGRCHIYIYIYIYISAEASMASRRVEAGPPILKTLSSPQPGEGFPFLPLPSPRLTRLEVPLGKICPLGNVNKNNICSTFPRMGPQGFLKDPSRILQGSPRTPQAPPRPPQRPPRPPKAAPNAPEGSTMPSQEPPNAQNTKNHRFTMFS